MIDVFFYMEAMDFVEKRSSYLEKASHFIEKKRFVVQNAGVQPLLWNFNGDNNEAFAKSRGEKLIFFLIMYPKKYGFVCEIYGRNLCVKCMVGGWAGWIRTRDYSMLAIYKRIFTAKLGDEICYRSHFLHLNLKHPLIMLYIFIPT